MKATLKTLQAQKLGTDEVFVLRNHNGTVLATSSDAFAIKEEQEMYRMVTGNDTHMAIEMDPVDYYQQDASASRELG